MIMTSIALVWLITFVWTQSLVFSPVIIHVRDNRIGVDVWYADQLYKKE